MAIKFKKLKNNITASFEAKIGWKMLRKRENKNYCSVTFLPDGLEKFQKVAKKYKKLKIYRYGFISSQNRSEKAEKVRKIKIIVLFRSYPTSKNKLQKNSKN